MPNNRKTTKPRHCFMPYPASVRIMGVKKMISTGRALLMTDYSDDLYASDFWKVATISECKHVDYDLALNMYYMGYCSGYFRAAGIKPRLRANNKPPKSLSRQP